MTLIYTGFTTTDNKVGFALAVMVVHKKAKFIRRLTWKVISKLPDPESGLKVGARN